MNINTRSCEDSAARLQPIAPHGPPVQTTPRQRRAKSEFKLEHVEKLRTVLAQVPEIRPEIVKKGMTIGPDPNYPGPAELARLAKMIADAQIE